MRFLLFIAFGSVATLARADSTLAGAEALLQAKRYPEARVVLEKIVAAEPTNATALHDLGLVYSKRHDLEAEQEAVKWLARAAELEPNNATYLADFGGTSMELASHNRSISAATKGRAAMEKAIALDPENLDAREGLFQFYLRAPFFVGGSEAKAAAELEEIRRRNPGRAIALAVLTKANAKDYAGAFALCDEFLARKPDDYAALYQYGRTAGVSGQNLERGLADLRKCLTLTPPGPAAPTHSHVWCRIGIIEEKLGHTAGARDAYAKALELDSSNSQAADGVARLK
jgi:tetratricopeptide (TPR) repeat protein